MVNPTVSSRPRTIPESTELIKERAARLALLAAWLPPAPAVSQNVSNLEVEAQFQRFGARRHEVRAAERGEEVVQRFFVGQIDHREAQAPLVAVAVEEIVMADGQVEQIARRNSRRILVVVLGSVRGNVNRVAPCGGASSGSS